MDNFDPKKESKGLGDSIAKVTNFLGIDKVADAIAKLAGAAGCGCAERREYLNELFPYSTSTRQFMVLRDIKMSQFAEEYLEGTIIEVGRSHELFTQIFNLTEEKFLVEVE